MTGVVCETIVSLPYGDGQNTAGTCGDESPMHFTGKMRDTESNLDDFDARYYSSEWGRFMIPDWDAKPVGVPYAKFGDPQSLDLYHYVRNNPSTSRDPDGHDTVREVGPHGEVNPTPPMSRTEARVDGAIIIVGGAALVPMVAEAGAAGILLRNLIALGLATAPTTVPIIGGAIEGLTPGAPGSLTIASGTRLSEEEISTGLRLADQLGQGLREGSHKGKEFVNKAGQTYDAVNSVTAYKNWAFQEQNILKNIKTTAEKSVDFVAVDLKGASKEQIAIIKNFVKTLTKAQQKKIIYVR